MPVPTAFGLLKMTHHAFSAEAEHRFHNPDVGSLMDCNKPPSPVFWNPLQARKYGGRVLVSRESADGELEETWEEVYHGGGIGAVQTPREVYQGLQREGFAVDYCRCARCACRMFWLSSIYLMT